MPVSKASSFVDYAAGGFTAEDQKRLRDLCVELDEKGAVFIQSNSDTPLINELYTDTGFRMISHVTNRLISSKVSSRASGRELLITNSQA